MLWNQQKTEINHFNTLFAIETVSETYFICFTIKRIAFDDSMKMNKDYPLNKFRKALLVLFLYKEIY
jgi:hypothetical protein